MGVSIEPQVFVVRYGKEHEKFGDPYSGSCVIRKTLEGCEIISATGDVIQHGEVKEIKQLVKELGIKGKIVWVRHRPDGTVHAVRMNL